MLTTHAMDEAEQLCDHIAIVDHGRVVAYGSPAELTSSAAVDEVRFSAAPHLACDELATALGVRAGSVAEDRPGAYRIAADATPDLVADLALWLRDRNVRLGELHAGQQSLEEVFLKLTGDGA